MLGSVLPALVILTATSPQNLRLTAPDDLTLEGKLRSASYLLDANRVFDLLKKGASPFKFHVLPDLARRGDRAYSVMKLLLDAGVSANHGSPLREAISSKWPSDKVIRLLINHKCEVGPDAWALGSPLNDAISYGKLDLVRLLVESGADLEGVPTAGYSGRTPISISAGSMLNRSLILDYLLEKGARVRSTDQKGNTPLHYASRAKNHHALKRLLEGGADVHAVSKDKKTPLHEAVSGHCYGLYYSTVKLLLESGADKNARDNRGKTALENFLTQVSEMRHIHTSMIAQLWTSTPAERHEFEIRKAAFEIDVAATEQLLKT